MDQDNRKKHVDCILTLLFELGGKVFGGYLRDRIAGVSWNDLDVAFSKIAKVEEFIKILTAFYHVWESQKNGKTDQSRYANRSIELTSKIDNVHIKVDVNYAICGELIDLDFDVNGFVQYSDHGLYHRQTLTNVLDLQDQIRRKEFEIVANIDNQARTTKERHFNLVLAKRICKMLNNGWTCLNLEETTMDRWIIKGSEYFKCIGCGKKTSGMIPMDNISGEHGHFDCLVERLPSDWNDQEISSEDGEGSSD